MVKVTTILADFAAWSTVACVRNIAYSESRWLRFFWFIVFLVFIVMFIYQLVAIILKYLSFPSDMATSIVFSSQPFPDVTFCSFNPFKLSVVNQNQEFSEIKKMLDEYKAAEQETAGTNEFGFRGLDRYDRLDRANDLLVLLAAKLTEDQKAPATYKMEELVTECLFAGQTCDAGAIEPVPDPIYGRCFAYRGGNRTITRTGLAHGLRLILTANLADSLTFKSDYLPTTSRIGVRMTLNEQDSFVDLDSRGVNSRIERAKAPYGDCVNEIDRELNYYSDLPYTIDVCFATCMQKKIVARCGCAHPQYRKADNETWCSTSEHASCIATHRGDQQNAVEKNLNQMDDCGYKPACNETRFRSVLSVLTYPAFGYTVGVGTTDQLKNQKQEQESRTTTTTPLPLTVPTTPSSPSSEVSTEASTETTTTMCPDYTLDAKYTALVNYPNGITGAKKFKVSQSQDACMPLFECDPSYSSEWWTCWPCFYECAGGGRLPEAPYSTPDVNCRDNFAFAKFRTGMNEGCATARPDWPNWNARDKYPSSDECAAERVKITAVVPPVTIPTGSELITNCTILEAIMRMDPASFILDHPYRAGCPKPKVTKASLETVWYLSWPCSYNCGNYRYPTTGTYSGRCEDVRLNGFKCEDFFNCFNNAGLASSYIYRPNVRNWETGTTGIKCNRVEEVGEGTSGPFEIGTNNRVKRSAVADGSMTATPGKGSCESWNTNFKSVDDCKTWYKKNGMIVNVYYETLEYQVLTESASYSIPQAINDLGGQAGLWLGLSVVSVVECVGLLMMILLFCVTGKRMAVNGTKEVTGLLPPTGKEQFAYVPARFASTEL